jgi:hypothetical protein
MTALAGDRNTKRAKRGIRSFLVKGGVLIYEGAIVSLGTDGYARPGRTSTTDKSLGRARHRADNVAGADGAIRIDVESDEIVFYANSAAGDAIAVTDVGADCYIVDDQTVAKTNGTNTRVRAGIIDSVTVDGVGVNFDK